jgi:hypothetical protein
MTAIIQAPMSLQHKATPIELQLDLKQTTTEAIAPACEVLHEDVFGNLTLIDDIMDAGTAGLEGLELNPGSLNAGPNDLTVQPRSPIKAVVKTETLLCVSLLGDCHEELELLVHELSHPNTYKQVTLIYGANSLCMYDTLELVAILETCGVPVTCIIGYLADVPELLLATCCTKVICPNDVVIVPVSRTLTGSFSNIQQLLEATTEHVDAIGETLQAANILTTEQWTDLTVNRKPITVGASVLNR